MGSFVKAIRYIFSIISLVVIALLAMLYFDPYQNMSVVDEYITNYDWAFYTLLGLIGVSVLGFIIFFIQTIVAPSKKSSLVDESEGGAIKISRDALEGSARRAASSFEGAICQEAYVKVIQGKAPYMDVEIDMYAPRANNLNELGLQVQQAVKERLEIFTGYPVKNVQVNFDKSNLSAQSSNDTSTFDAERDDL